MNFHYPFRLIAVGQQRYGVLLTEPAVVFNLPCLAALNNPGELAFEEIRGPSGFMNRDVMQQIAEEFEHPDALKRIVTCTLYQADSGVAKRAPVAWSVNDTGFLDTEAVHPSEDGDINRAALAVLDRLTEVLLLNFKPGLPSRVTEEFKLADKTTGSLSAFVGKEGIGALLEIGCVHSAISAAALDDFNGALRSASAGRKVLDLGATRISMSQHDAIALANAAHRLNVRLDETVKQNCAVRWDDPQAHTLVDALYQVPVQVWESLDPGHKARNPARDWLQITKDSLDNYGRVSAVLEIAGASKLMLLGIPMPAVSAAWTAITKVAQMPERREDAPRA
jgi:hypothetical protein